MTSRNASTSRSMSASLATIGGARALGMETVIGSLEAGKRADLTVVSLAGSPYLPWEDPAVAVVFGGSPERVELTLVDGQLASKHDSARTVSIADAMRHGGVERIQQEKTTTPAEDTARSHNVHSAIFAEVNVDEQLGVVRVTRVVSAVAAGRILNTKTAASQILGGVVWGIGMALHEETLIDHRFGRIMNANIAEYHVPVNADVHDIKVIFVDEPDDSNPLGIKGLGEIGIVGVAAAVANAVYHATGTRVRNLPITLDKLHRM